MAELILGPMLRHVDDTSATIFVETDGPCDVEVLGRTTRTFRVRGHHYALVVVEDLEPGSTREYDVLLDGERCWPQAGSTFPPSVIRTTGGERRTAPLRLLFGSCRTAAPHEPPYTEELAHDARGRGVDALWRHALEMLEQPPEQWPHLMVMMGDQVYADDTSPVTRERIERRRGEGEDLDPDLVRDFEEYCWLYHESWRPAVERWFFSVVPTAMIFDDHDMIDDWNISASWVRDIREQPWWEEHVVGGLVSYWVYQHLGNLSPTRIREEGLLARALAEDDAWSLLREWALESERFTPVAGGYRFSFRRDLGDARIVVIDSRNGRVLDGGPRAMLDDGEWAWVVEQCVEPAEHLVLVTSLPVFVPGGMHDIQTWSEVLCDGRWGARPARLGERLRRSIDLEDWPAFARSFDAMADLLADVASGRFGRPPSTVTVLSGDIHFSYLAEVRWPHGRGVTAPVRQVVCSPLRNALAPRERAVIRFALTRPGRAVGRALRRAAGRARTECRWRITQGPVFGNCIGVATFDGPALRMCIEQAAAPDDAAAPPGSGELSVAIEEQIGGDGTAPGAAPRAAPAPTASV